jgi:hypothetical protein
MSDSVYGAPRGFNTAPISGNYIIRINTDDLVVFPNKNTTVKPGGLSFASYNGTPGTGGTMDITGADKATIAALGPGAVTRDTVGCAERIRQDAENLAQIYRVNPCDFDYHLPFPIHNVQQLQMLSFNIPSIYNISSSIGNNYLTYFRPQADGTVDLSSDNAVVVELPKGNYSSIQSILTLINTALALGTQGTDLSPQFRYDNVSDRVYFVDNEDDASGQKGIHGILDFRHPSVNGAGSSIPRSGSLAPDSHSLGWLLGFRRSVYTGGEVTGALPDMYEQLYNFPNYEGDWPGGVIDSAYVPPTTTNPNAGDSSSNFTPWGYVAEANFDLNNQNLYISIEDNLSNKIGGYIYTNATTEATGLNNIIARFPLSSPEDFSSTVRTYIQPYPTITRIKVKIFDEKGRIPDFGLTTVNMELQITNIMNATDPLPNGATF